VGEREIRGRKKIINRDIEMEGGREGDKREGDNNYKF